MPFASELNPFSQRFAAELFAAHPEWRSLGRQDPTGFPSPGSLLLEVPSPVAGRPLTIRTYGGEITIDFGPHGWHTHFGDERGTTEEAVFGDAIAFIDDLVTERVVITTRFLFGRPAWSRAIPAGRVRRPVVGRVEVHSWSGGRDATLGPT